MLFFFALSLVSSYEFRQKIIYRQGDQGSKWYRIPVIGTTSDNRLMTITDARWQHSEDLPNNISLVVKYSSDKGLTWTDSQQITKPNIRGYGDAALVIDRRTGTIVVLYNGQNGLWGSTPSNPMRQFVLKSYDNGKTWSEPKDITDFIYGSGCSDPVRSKWYAVFITSGSATQLRDGTIMAAIVVRHQSSGTNFLNYAIYSHDLGETWEVSQESAIKSGDTKGDESKVLEINNGDVIMSIRTAGKRRFAYSHDKGKTWDKPIQTSISDSNCNGDFVRLTSIRDGFDKDRIVHTVPFNSPPQRKNVSMLLSYDEGKTWPVSKVINPKMSGYSVVTMDHDGMIHVYYEENVNPNVYDYNFSMTVASFNLEWLTDGKDSFKKAEGIDWCICDNSELECTSTCPVGSVRLSTILFEQYSKYPQYPTSFKYTFVSQTDKVALDLSTSGLLNAEFNNKFGKKQGIKVSGSGGSKPVLKFKNMIVYTNVDSLNSFGSTTFDDSYLKLDDNIVRIEVGRTKVRISKESILADSDSAVITTNEFNFNHYQTAKTLKILNGISDIPGEESAQVKTKIIIENHTKISIEGHWEPEDVHSLTIYKPTSNIVFGLLVSDQIIYENLLIVEEGKTNTPFPLPKQTPKATQPTNPDEDISGGDRTEKPSSSAGTVAAVVVVIIVIIVAGAIVGVFIWRKKNDSGKNIAVKAELV